MIKLMIVDDEAGIRKGLIHYINWSAWDINLVAEAADGDEAYPIAIQTQPDILISDIRMPGRTGLQLAEDLAEVLPAMRVILLTGHNDTAYLQAALRMGVKDYLLKPAGADNIIQAVLKVQKEILAERNQNLERFSKDSLLNESLPILQMHFMHDIVSGRATDHDAILHKAQRLGLPLDFPFVQVGLLRIGEADTTQFRSTKEQVMNSWQLNHTLDQLLEKHAGSFFVEIEPELYVWVVGSDSDAQVRKSFQLLAADLTSLLPAKDYPYLALGIGSVVTDLRLLSDSYQQAYRALNQWAWETDNRVFSGPAAPDLAHLQRARLSKKAASAALVQENFLRCIEHFEAMFAAYRLAHADIEEVKESCRHLLSIAAHHQQGTLAGETGDDLDAGLSPLDALFDANKIRAWTLDRLARLYQRDIQPSSPLVSKARAYIRQHYAEDINLQTMAPALFVSPNYLGRIFREQTGFKLCDWLNKHRVERAKELLDDPELKIYEVAERVGFSSYKYFSVCFLKYAGCSARDYRGRHSARSALSSDEN
jgi:DNA-binding NarL/FixJ family response regulator/AraC-like DNA-binding protein